MAIPSQTPSTPSGSSQSASSVSPNGATSTFDRLEVALTGDGRDGHTSRAQHEHNIDSYLAGMAPFRRGKALVSRSDYEAILRIACAARDKVGCKENTPQYRSWVRRSFTLEVDGDTPILLRHGLPVAFREEIYDKILQCHIECSHRGRDTTWDKVNARHSYIQKDIVASFVASCPACHAHRIGDSNYFNWKVDGYYPVAPLIRAMAIAAGHATPETYRYPDCNGYEPTLPPEMTKLHKLHSGPTAPTPLRKPRASTSSSGITKPSARARGRKPRVEPQSAGSNTSSSGSLWGNNVIVAGTSSPSTSLPSLNSPRNGDNAPPIPAPQLPIASTSNLHPRVFHAPASAIDSSNAAAASFPDQQQGGSLEYSAHRQQHQAQQAIDDPAQVQYQRQYYANVPEPMPAMNVATSGDMGGVLSGDIVSGMSVDGQFLYGGSGYGRLEARGMASTMGMAGPAVPAQVNKAEVDPLWPEVVPMTPRTQAFWYSMPPSAYANEVQAQGPSNTVSDEGMELNGPQNAYPGGDGVYDFPDPYQPQAPSTFADQYFEFDFGRTDLS